MIGFSYSNQGGLAHLFDGLKYAMLDFATGETSAAQIVAPFQRIHISSVTKFSGDVVGVRWVEQDKS